jgi:phenylacetic acid degradation protein paaN
VTSDLFDKHEDRLKGAVAALESRRFWSPYPESPRAYPDGAPKAGEDAFRDRLGKPFSLDHIADEMSSGEEDAPYGVELGITYPRAAVEDLIGAAAQALASWGTATPEERIGVCLEVLEQLELGTFEMAYAVMQTTGQPFLMAFRSGGPYALERALEAIAHAHVLMARVPRGTVRWEKPQGRRDPLQVDKQWLIRPRGIAIAMASPTSPTLDSYPGIFASLATGNPVIVKPDAATILPLALFVATARRVLADAGHDPNAVLLAVDTAADPIGERLVTHPAVRIVDYSGEPRFGTWLEQKVMTARVYTQKAAVNSVVIDSVDDLRGVMRDLPLTLAMYSGQMRTTPQNVYIPADGIAVGEERRSFGEVASALTSAIEDLLSDDQRAADILGALKTETLGGSIVADDAGDIVLPSRRIKHPNFPYARVFTPTVVRTGSSRRAVFSRNVPGPVVFIVRTSGTTESLELASSTAAENGALNWLVYTTDEDVVERAVDAAAKVGVSPAFNLTGGVYVNDSAPFSDLAATGANPSGNAAVTAPSFVADRFRVIGVRRSPR